MMVKAGEVSRSGVSSRSSGTAAACACAYFLRGLRNAGMGSKLTKLDHRPLLLLCPTFASSLAWSAHLAGSGGGGGGAVLHARHLALPTTVTPSAPAQSPRLVAPGRGAEVCGDWGVAMAPHRPYYYLL